jgi:hypothetical protein
MKHFLILALFLASGAQLVAQTSDTRNVGSFKGVKAAEGIDVYLKKATKESVRVEAVNPDASDVITEVSGGYLKIHLKDGRNYRSVNVKVYVEYIALDKLSVSSAASMFSEGTIKAQSMDINASSAGEMKISVEAESVVISASSAGEVEVKGKATRVTADASSAGEVDAFDLEAQTVNAEASSAGSVQVSVSQTLTAHASSGGDVRYRGNPDKSNTNASSGGSVKKTN